MTGSDHVEIANLLAEYSERFDEGDFEGFGALFEHGTWFPTAAEGKGAGPARRWCEENVLLYDGSPRTKHVITNIRMDIDAAGGVATARSYVTVWQHLQDFPLQVIFIGRYRDRIERVDERWCFRERLVIPDVMGDMSRHLRMLQSPDVT